MKSRHQSATTKMSGYAQKIVLLAFALAVAINGFAQDPQQKSFSDDPFSHPMTPVYMTLFSLAVLVILVLVVVVYVVQVMTLLRREIEKNKREKLGLSYIPKPSWWSRLIQTVNASVPLEKEKDIDLGHSYDGIRELDNHLPPWWKWLFYGTIVWSVVYMVAYHVSDTLPLSEQEYLNEVAQAEEQARKLMASQPEAAIDVATLQFTNDAAIISNGKSIFMNTSCVSCHRVDGGGNTIGPNLTDEYWIHGGSIQDIFNTINNGFVDKGMPAWGKSMSQQDVRDVAFFVMSLRGTNPANSKAPQGELYKEKPIVVSDSTAKMVQASM